MAKIRALMLRYTRVDATTIHVAQFDCQLETARRICFTFIFLFQFPFSLSFYFFVVWKRLKIRAAGQHMFGSLTVTQTRTHMPFTSWLLLLAAACGVDLKINIAKIAQHTHICKHMRQPANKKARKGFRAALPNSCRFSAPAIHFCALPANCCVALMLRHFVTTVHCFIPLVRLAIWMTF